MNWNSKYVSINQILSKVFRDMKVGSSVSIADAIEWAGEALELIGAPYHFTEKVAQIPIVNYKGKLPCDLHYIVTTKGIAMDIQDTECALPIHGFTAMRYSTDAFHHWYCKGNRDNHCQSALTYKVNDNYLFTNFETGYVLIAYKGIPVDENGYPKIPDDIKFKEAVTGHIKWRIASIMADEGKIPQWRYQKYEQDRDWYIGAAQTRGNMPSVDLAESIKNNWIRLIPKINQHSDGFASAGSQEQRYTHNSTVSTDTTPTGTDNDTYFHLLTND